MVAAAERLAPRLGPAPTILDLGCGYGTFGAVLRHYGSAAALYAATAAGTLKQPPRRRTPLAAARIVGLDTAAAAARFAEAAGFLDGSVTEDLTSGSPGADAAVRVGATDLVLEVGIEWPALGALLPNLLPVLTRRPPVLLGPRGDAPTRPAFKALAAAGYTGRRLTEEPLRFRRFVDEAERRSASAREREPGATAASDDAGYRMHLFLFECRQAGG